MMHEQLNSYLTSNFHATMSIFFLGAGAMVLAVTALIITAAYIFLGRRQHRAVPVFAIVVAASACIAAIVEVADVEAPDDARKDQVVSAITQDLKDQYKIADAKNVTSLEQLNKNDWANRPQVTVLLESGDTATYDIGFDKNDDLTLYLPPNASQPDPATLKR